MWIEKVFTRWNLVSSLDNTMLVADSSSLKVKDEIQDQQGVGRNSRWLTRGISERKIQLCQLNCCTFWDWEIPAQTEGRSLLIIDKMENKCRICHGCTAKNFCLGERWIQFATASLRAAVKHRAAHGFAHQHGGEAYQSLLAASSWPFFEMAEDTQNKEPRVLTVANTVMNSLLGTGSHANCTET